MALDRRTLLTSAAAAGTLLVGCSTPRRGPELPGAHDEEVTPAEDLMREHGVLRRVMYLYDEAATRLDPTGLRPAPRAEPAGSPPRDSLTRLDAQGELPLDALAAGAGIIRRVIEDYHERLEEDFLFPRFEQAGKLADLTAILRRQHQAGRALTERITALAGAPLADAADRAKLASLLRSFNRMYRPHAAREDTVLFPALRALVGAKAYAELGEQFEDKEHAVLGDHGFERAVEDVARLERAFGLDDLAKLTA